MQFTSENRRRTLLHKLASIAIDQLALVAKGQRISDIFFFSSDIPKKTTPFLPTATLASKKWLKQKTRWLSNTYL